jgi:large repetitive protein
MISTPFNIINPSLGWTPVPTTITYTIGAVAIGGFGLLGNGGVSLGVAITGPSSSSGAPNAVAQPLKGGTVGTAYSETINAVNGASPYTFAVSSGSLPAGCSLNTSTGVISGTPTTAASYSFSVQATDAGAVVGPAQSFQIVIAASGSGSSSGFGWVS